MIRGRDLGVAHVLAYWLLSYSRSTWRGRVLRGNVNGLAYTRITRNAGAGQGAEALPLACDVIARAKSVKERSQSMTEKLTSYDPAVALVDDEEITFFMADAFETGDSGFIAKALGVVARAKGMLGTVTDAELSSCFEHRDQI